MSRLLPKTYERDESRFPSHLSSITIPSNVTRIGILAFRFYEELATVIIPPSITSISDGAFDECRSLATITIPPSIKSIGNGAFSGCRSLTTINIPPAVTSINSYVFYECHSITTINIPPTVTSIGNGVFYGCRSLTTITIPPSMESIGHSIFIGCDSITTINLTLPLVLEENPKPNMFEEAVRAMKPENVNRWAKTRSDQDSRLPLLSAAAASLKWKYTKLIFDANMIVIYERDVMTGLSPFMLAAVGLNSDIESVYRLLREHPAAVSR